MNNQTHYTKSLWSEQDDVIYVPLELTGATGKDLLDMMLARKIEMETSIQNLFLSEDFTPSKPRRFNLAIMKGTIFEGLGGGFESTREEAMQRLFQTAELEMVARYLLNFTNQEILKMGFGCIVFMTEKFISPTEKIPYLLAIDCVGNSPDLISFWEESYVLTNKYDGYAYADFRE